MSALAEIDFTAFPQKSRWERVAEEAAKGTAINFGLVHEGKRTEEQNEAKQAIVKKLPRFAIRGRFTLAARRYALWKYVRQLLGGKDPTYNYQQTGACVGAGWGNMAIISQGVEIVLKGDAEDYKWLWWPYTYGKGRQRGGMSGQGEGSFGAAQAEAATKDGSFELDPAGEPDLPDPKITDNWAVLPASVEMQWSDGGRIAQNWSKLGVKHLFKTAAQLRSADDVIDAMANGYAVTQASSFGFSPMVPPTEGKGENAVRLVRKWNATWNHQTYIPEFWDHPDLGPIFGWGNNWGATAHNPNGETPGGYPNMMVYITYELMDRICKSRDGEVFAFSAYDGFPARESKLREADFNPFR
jgi:hypothetical protein